MHIEENQFESTLYVVFQASRYPNLLSYYWSIKGLWHLKLFIQKIMIWSRKWMNYYIIIKRKYYTWKQRILGKSQSIWVIFSFLIINKGEKKFWHRRYFPLLKLVRKEERTHQNKNFLLEKTWPLNSSFWNRGGWVGACPPLVLIWKHPPSTLCISLYPASRSVHI